MNARPYRLVLGLALLLAFVGGAAPALASTSGIEGNSQVLDQILVSQALLGGESQDDDESGAGRYDVVHVNAEFAVQDSDHDPSVMWARFGG